MVRISFQTTFKPNNQSERSLYDRVWRKEYPNQLRADTRSATYEKSGNLGISYKSGSKIRGNELNSSPIASLRGKVLSHLAIYNTRNLIEKMCSSMTDRVVSLVLDFPAKLLTFLRSSIKMYTSSCALGLLSVKFVPIAQ